MKTNIRIESIDRAARTARQIRQWLGARDHPDTYQGLADPSEIRDFVHTLDLLETVLVRFEVQARLTEIALEDMDGLGDRTLGEEFWQIDVEESFASSSLELAYQLSNAWKKLAGFASENNVFSIFSSPYVKLSDTFLARHKGTHFDPKGFQNHKVSNDYAILRRPYSIVDGKLEKEMAKYTLPKIARLVRDAFKESDEYISTFWQACSGEEIG
jgi:hypothetical protein